MKTILLKNASAVLPNETAENVSLLIENGVIAEISERELAADEVINLEGAKVFAGFIDIHNHGAVGVDVNNARVEDLFRVGKFLARKGVTAWLPTLVPDGKKKYGKAIKAIEGVRKLQTVARAAQILGVHYEGIFANTKMCGALRPAYFRTFTDGSEVTTLPKIKNGCHLMTLAPEQKNGIELINKLIEENWIVSIGHTNADLEILNRAFAAGARHVTHFFNAMSGIHHREMGVAGWALLKKDVTFDIIADGIHVTPPMLKLACRVKSPRNVSLISDSIAPTGLGDGEFEVWGEKISVVNGKTKNERGSIAGSVVTMLGAVRRMLRLGFSEVEVSLMASANPAKLLGIDQNYGTIEIGKRADLVALDEKGNVKLTIIGGKIV